jgi:plastocyanin
MIGIRGPLMSLARLRTRTLALSLAVFGASLAVPATLVASQRPAAPATDPAQPAGNGQQGPPSPTPPPAEGPQPGSTGATGPSGSGFEQEQSGSGAGGAAASPAFRASPAAAAGSSSVSARDNVFAPSSITIQVGESVTWSNDGQNPHTVTANGGGFDSGNLNPGQGFSYTFSQAGTFAYFCQYHRSLGMKGTVTVQASGSGGGGGGGGSPPGASGSGPSTGAGTSTTGPASESAAGSSPDAAGTSTSLPSTGLPVLPLLAAACGLLVLGALLRRHAGGRFR